MSKKIAFLFLFCLPLLVKADETRVLSKSFPVSDEYSVIVSCAAKNDGDDEEGNEEKCAEDKPLILSLVKQSVPLSTLEFNLVEEDAFDRILVEDFDGDGIKDLSISAGNQAASPYLYFLTDVKNQQIIFAGEIPKRAVRFPDGSYEDKELSCADYCAMFRTIYVFQDKKVIQKKDSVLVYEGTVCLKKDAGSGEYITGNNCKNGIKTSKRNPVCFEKKYSGNFRVVPLKNCSINKKEVLSAHWE